MAVVVHRRLFDLGAKKKGTAGISELRDGTAQDRFGSRPFHPGDYRCGLEPGGVRVRERAVTMRGDGDVNRRRDLLIETLALHLRKRLANGPHPGPQGWRVITRACRGRPGFKALLEELTRSTRILRHRLDGDVQGGLSVKANGDLLPFSAG